MKSHVPDVVMCAFISEAFPDVISCVVYFALQTSLEITKSRFVFFIKIKLLALKHRSYQMVGLSMTSSVLFYTGTGA